MSEISPAGGPIWMELLQERERQLELGYTAEHDDQHGFAELTMMAHYRLGHMGEVSSPAEVRAEIVEATAMLVAALESMDRAPDQLEMHAAPWATEVDEVVG